MEHRKEPLKQPPLYETLAATQYRGFDPDTQHPHLPIGQIERAKNWVDENEL